MNLQIHLLHFLELYANWIICGVRYIGLLKVRIVLTGTVFILYDEPWGGGYCSRQCSRTHTRRHSVLSSLISIPFNLICE